MVADALIHKVASPPIQGLCLRMNIVSPLSELIREAQVEGIMRENLYRRRLRARLENLLPIIDGL